MSNDDKDKARVLYLETSIHKKIMDGTDDASSYGDYLQVYLARSFGQANPRSTEKNGIIRSKVIANGWTGPEWEKFYDENGYQLTDDTRKFLNSPDFKPTPAGTIVHFAVLKGDLFADNHRTTENIRAKARKLKFKKANHDLACLIRKEFTNEEIKEMGIWVIVGMSDTIDISGGGPRLLGAYRDGSKPWLSACYDKLGGRWNRDDGFAFLSPAS